MTTTKPAEPAADHARVAASETPAPTVPRSGRVFDALSLPHFPAMWLSGSLWHICRWVVSFLAAYLAQRLSGSPRLIQLTGVSMWTPLLLGGAIGGVISDRVDRRRTVIAQFLVLIPLVAAFGVLRLSGHLRLWMIYPFMVIIGIGWVIDMTSRRTLIYDLVGPTRIDNAMALESMSLATGMALGALFGGTAIDAIGVGAAYLAVAALLAVSLLLFLNVPRSAFVHHLVKPVGGSPLRDLRDGFGLLAHHPQLVSVLGITAIVNFFYFTFTPLVQALGRRLDVGATLIGLLAAMSGVGMLVASTAVARLRPRRRGLAYVGGSAVAMLLLVPFALSRWYPVSLVFLLLSACGMGLFGSTQAVLVMTSVPAEVRGRALGLLSMAIGTLPIGMIALGEVAERVGPPAAIVGSTLTGFVLLAAWQWRHPEASRITTS